MRSLSFQDMFKGTPIPTLSDPDLSSRCCVRIIAIAAAMVVLLGVARAADNGLVVKTQSGRVRGREIAGLSVFKGIPYAAAPVGVLRWKPPQPSPRWQSIRDAGKFGAVCPQPKVPPNLGGLDVPQSENCLTLNIWAPRNSKKAPVMVWIHGGGFTVGAGSAPYYDGTAFARDGVILVTLNYRLGILGFFAHPALTAEAPPDAPLGNYGIMDQIAALRWVHENIGAFGGDPSNVTVAGESAGGASILWLLGLPDAKTLFARAIVESAPAWSSRPTLQHMEARGRHLAAAAGLAGSISADDLRRVPVEMLLAARAKGRYGPVVDGRLFTETPEQRFADGTAASMPILIGSNSFEGSIMKAVGVDEASLLAQAPASVRAVYGDGGIDDARLAESIFTDAQFGAPARWFALKMSATAPAYVYYFSYVTSQRRSLAKGAGHGAEITYVFETGGWLERLYGVKLSEQDRQMAHLMHSCWVGFVRYGDPHCDGARWPRLDSEHDEILEFGAETRVRTQFKSRIYDALQKVYLRRALNHRVRR